ncbi:MAG: hypothetical protein E6G76_11940 [Alphaproteobacteria bacterium]|nr:MAG: hypothetical protein E6G76_11940 [Alphaproteobacteria bacterium]
MPFIDSRFHRDSDSLPGRSLTECLGNGLLEIEVEFFLLENQLPRCPLNENVSMIDRSFAARIWKQLL